MPPADAPPVAAIALLLGEAVTAAQPVGGGCIHSAWSLQLTDGRRLFAKTNRAPQLPLLEAECEGLGALAAAAGADLEVPRPLFCGQWEDLALLVMTWLPLNGAGETGAWSSLGAGLARLHRRSLESGPGDFGWARDNFIGSGPQCNGWMADWGRFFAERRLGEQLAWAKRQGQSFEGSEVLLEQVPQWLAHHAAEPCLVHGDLWSGNAGVLTGGGGALFDPAVYRADREVDLAMARLFGGFPSSFFAGYEAEWPLPTAHRVRVDLYNLYHLLNHANLFGGGYGTQAQRRILALLRNPPVEA
ncbi:fructosamine kinase family protein [Cyanobium sp. Morenito 9A2]|uniref:fructosamine kinase family protein n=1 Tax=Cyanobium sp. Morenito 9A2 TaxID=2823718 RepID=UPI0020CD8B64|nr:fructosamine kinase family protein [Cyanobium sp. Morenito 9A2]MCP9850610.1 fructosamine kinase family protein [Cyanobium sp. Morenito 9A2]